MAAKRFSLFFTPIFWQQKGEIYLQEELGAIIHLALPEIKKHSSQKTNQKPISTKLILFNIFCLAFLQPLRCPPVTPDYLPPHHHQKAPVQLNSSQFHSTVECKCKMEVFFIVCSFMAICFGTVRLPKQKFFNVWSSYANLCFPMFN